MIRLAPAAYRAALLLALAVPAAASERVDAGPHTIYATALSSLLIPADVARQHGIVRSSNRIVVNVTVLNNNHPTRARVSGSGTNLLGQRATLDFAEVREQDAIYYLASLVTNEKDTVRFELTVTPDGAETTQTLRFERTYYPRTTQ
mgnify:CR=1 FL=1